MDNVEPPEKRAKMADEVDQLIENIVNSETNLKAIVSDEYIDTIPLIKAYAGYVKDQKMLSHTISILNRNLPLTGLQHLKRVNKSCVLLCPVSYLNSTVPETIQDFIERCVPELRDAFDYFKDIDAPLYPPKTKKQHTESNRKWSCNFHPVKYVEKLLSDSFFKQDELISHRLYMGMALRVAQWYSAKRNLVLIMQDMISSDTNAAVIVDPSIESVVAVTCDNRHNHPIQHAAMLAIDEVAKTQNGGAWTSKYHGENKCGINNEIVEHLKTYFSCTKFGSREYYTKEEIADSSKLSENPYLCTGYYIYLLREPCVMCAMALVHARVKRIFFCFNNQEQGALMTKTKLQCNPSLNHRFEVFSGFIQNSTFT